MTDLEKLIMLETEVERLKAKLEEHRINVVEPMLAELEKKRTHINENARQIKTLRLRLARKWENDALKNCAASAKVPAQIFALMDAQPDTVWTARTLEKAGVKSSSIAVISAAMSRLSKDGKIERVSWGHYRKTIAKIEKKTTLAL